MLGEPAHRIAHVLRPGGAVEPDHMHGERLERRHRAGDVGAEQHAAARVERHLRLHGKPAADFREQLFEAGDGRLDLEDVLRRLDEQHIHAAFDEVLRLQVVLLRKRGKGDSREGGIAGTRQHPRRANGAGHEARLIRRCELVARGAREARRRDVDVARLVLEPPFAEPARRALEGAGLHDVAADGEERLVDRLDDVGAREHQVVVAPLERSPAEVVGRQVVALDARPHRAVEHEHALPEGGEIIGIDRGRGVGQGCRGVVRSDEWSEEGRKTPLAIGRPGLAL